MTEAESLKNLLGERAKDIISTGYGLEVKRNKALCPLHNEQTPSFTWNPKNLSFKCFGCGETMDIFDYYQKREGMEFPEAIREVRRITGTAEPIKSSKYTYDLPKIDMKELEKPFIEYMNKRKISKETLEEWRVKQVNWKGTEVYCFPYYDKRDKLIYVSYRGLGKGGIKGGCEPNTKSILWGLWKIDIKKPVVIVEGQPDAMAVSESGYKNVLSVPNGTNNLKWIDHNWEFLNSIKSDIIIFADNDKPGLKMALDIKNKLPKVKIIEGYGRKDPNEVLYFDGKQAVMGLINEAIREVPKGLKDMSEIAYESYVEMKEETIETGIKDYDMHVEDLKMQELTVITGRNNEGKTTFLSQIIAHILKDHKVFLYSGEMGDKKIQDWMYMQMIAGDRKMLQTVQTKYRDKLEPRVNVIKAIKEWHKGKWFMYDRKAKPDNVKRLDHFFSMMELARKRYDVKVFFIDNLMAILEESEIINQEQSNFVQKLKEFAQDNYCHVVLVTHPNKIGMNEVFNGGQGNIRKHDISGTANIGNKADNIISVERDWGDEREYDAFISSLKDRETGQRNCFGYLFDLKSLRFHNEETPKKEVYGWEEMIDEVDKEALDGFETTDEKMPWDN